MTTSFNLVILSLQVECAKYLTAQAKESLAISCLGPQTSFQADIIDLMSGEA